MALIKCPECGGEISESAPACPHCGYQRAGFGFRPGLGYEYRSQTMLWGLPLVHIAKGVDAAGRRRVAIGIIAIGDLAVGVLAMGGASFGVITFGGVSIGLLALGGVAVGVLLAIGGCAIGGVAFGGLAIGFVAMGGGAIGYYALGGGAFGAHPLGGNAQDPAAIEFFKRWLGAWVEQIGRRR